MKFVFWGTPSFAALILKKLLNAGSIPAAVVTNPDRLAGRKKLLTPPAVKTEIKNEELESSIHIFQPENPVSLISYLSSLKPDLFIVAAYAKILPKEIISIPRLGTIGVHPSLLPKYRGASPIQSAILAGESETGVTLYRIDEKVDHGPIISNAKIQISNLDTTETLSRKLAECAGDLLIEMLSQFSKGMITPTPQNESKATYTKKFDTEDGFVPAELLEKAENDPSISSGQAAAFEIDRKIRALNPEPGVYTLRNNTRLKLLEARIENGKLKLIKIQQEGKKPITVV